MRTTNLPRIAAGLTLLATALFVTPPQARAAATPEQQCQKGRHDAAAKYAQCELKAMAKFFGTEDAAALNPALSKCRVKYTGTWSKLQKKTLGTGATCDAPRFDDRFGATVIDNLTGLEWKRKTTSGGPDGVNSVYSWTDAYSENLNFLNGGPVVSDWRLPTRAELQTILLDPFPCATSPCIDPVFEATTASFYWTATREPRPSFVGAWVVNFGTGLVGNASLTDLWYVRAVRGGLGGF